MKNKQQHWAKASFALLIFVILGYVIRFYPQQLTGFDSALQSTIRGDLPAPLTAFFTKVTHVMDTKIIVIWVGLLLAVFACKKWYSEALFLGSNLVLTGLLVLLLKNIYQRPRPSIFSSSRGKRLFFSKWSFTGVYPCFGKLNHYYLPAFKT